jgi:hypothetical protein
MPDQNRIAEPVEALSFFSGYRNRSAALRQAQGYGFLLAAAATLTACSTAPRAITERDMPGVYSADATPGHRALMIQFLNDGRFGGDAIDAGGFINTQGYWRIGALDLKRGCTIIETKPRAGEWREGFCASIENERTALNCKGAGDARSCLMTRRPGKWMSAPVKR